MGRVASVNSDPHAVDWTVGSRSEKRPHRAHDPAARSDAFVDLAEWFARPLNPGYAIVSFGPLRLPTPNGLTPEARAAWVAIGTLSSGRKDVLGVWIDEVVGQRVTYRAFDDLRQRGLGEIGMVIADLQRVGRDGIAAAYPVAQIQTCIPRLVMRSLLKVPAQQRRGLAMLLAPVFGAHDRMTAATALEAAEKSGIGQRYPAALAPWRTYWQNVSPAWDFPRKHQRFLQSTATIKELKAALRRSTAGKGEYFSELAALGILFRALRAIASQWQEIRAEPVDPLIAPRWEGAIPRRPAREACPA